MNNIEDYFPYATKPFIEMVYAIEKFSKQYPCEMDIANEMEVYFKWSRDTLGKSFGVDIEDVVEVGLADYEGGGWPRCIIKLSRNQKFKPFKRGFTLNYIFHDGEISSKAELFDMLNIIKESVVERLGLHYGATELAHNHSVTKLHKIVKITDTNYEQDYFQDN